MPCLRRGRDALEQLHGVGPVSIETAAQQYFDPPDPVERTYACSVEIDINATDEDDAYEQLRRILAGQVNDWYLDGIHPYGEPLL